MGEVPISMEIYFEQSANGGNLVPDARHATDFLLGLIGM